VFLPLTPQVSRPLQPRDDTRNRAGGQVRDRGQVAAGHRPAFAQQIKALVIRRPQAQAPGDRLVPNARSIARGHDGWVARTLKSWFSRVLPHALDHPHVITIVAAALLIVAAFAMTQMGTGFLPDFHEGSLTVQANTLPGTSLAKSDEIGRRVEQILLSQPEVVATARRTGRAELDEHVQGVEAAEIDVGLREATRPRAELLAALRRDFSTLPGTNVTIGQPISHRVDHMLSGTRENIAVKVFGDDLGTLRRLGEHVRDAMSKVPGVVDLSLEQQMDIPFVRFVVNRTAIARQGLRAEDVAEAVETSFAGATVGRIFDRGTAFDLVVKFDAGSDGLRANRRSSGRYAGGPARCPSACSPTSGVNTDENGSSSKRIVGLLARALAIARRCCSPPDNWLGRRLVMLPRPTDSRSAMAPATSRPTDWPTRRTCAIAVRCGHNARS
jgi:AcrB/AcrD/AcrF family protein